MDFNITICSIDPKFTELLNKEFPPNNKYNISVFGDDFRTFSSKYDAIVSAGNSNGLMDGGIDMAISNHLDHYIPFIKCVQSQLKTKCNFKHQPGAAAILDTNSSKCKYLIHIPTMIIPMCITDKSILYWGIYNMLHEVYNHNIATNDIKKILCAGLGTGAGGVPYIQFIKLVKLAYDHYMINKELSAISWDIANKQFIQLHKLVLSFDKSDEDIYNLMNYKRLMTKY